MHIGAHALANNLFVAPMAGVTDRPFRQLCRRLGAGHAVSEMGGREGGRTQGIDDGSVAVTRG